MKAYVTYSDFKTGGGATYGGSHAVIKRLLLMSSINADEFCRRRLGEDLSHLDARQKQLVKMAVIANTSNLLAQGADVYNAGNADIIESYKADDVSVSYVRGCEGGSDNATLSCLSKTARDFLTASGLAYWWG